MADSGVSFENALDALGEKEQSAFKTFVPHFQRKLADDVEIDRKKFFQEPDNFTMLRFLQADDYDIDRATTRLLNTCAWRQKSGFEDFVTKPNRKSI